MKSKKQNAQLSDETQVDAPAAQTSSSAAVVVPTPSTKLMEVDRLVLDLAKERRKTALAEAKTSLAQNDNAELAYKYVVLQIYMKYGLTEADAISEAGDIMKGGALPKQAQ